MLFLQGRNRRIDASNIDKLSPEEVTGRAVLLKVRDSAESRFLWCIRSINKVFDQPMLLRLARIDSIRVNSHRKVTLGPG